MKFECNQCGQCCKRIGKLVVSAITQEDHALGKVPLMHELARFPYSFDSYGACSMLNEHNKCSVYDNRPLVCDVKKMHKEFFAHAMSEKEFFSMNRNFCKTIGTKNVNS